MRLGTRGGSVGFGPLSVGGPWGRRRRKRVLSDRDVEVMGQAVGVVLAIAIGAALVLAALVVWMTWIVVLIGVAALLAELYCALRIVRGILHLAASWPSREESWRAVPLAAWRAERLRQPTPWLPVLDRVLSTSMRALRALPSLMWPFRGSDSTQGLGADALPPLADRAA